ncbi:MAG TPA: hypothetical protein VJ953_15820 [Saprospiraceae bacterium]|nr:hypothetical protein [Saprospiraceae bacterium]
MGVIALSALLLAGTGFFIFSRAFPNYRPGQKKLQADLKKLMQELDTITIDMVPIDVKELEALSTSQVQYNARTRVTKNVKGAFVSIFEEGIFKYAYRQYASGKKDNVLLAMTHNHQFAFLTKSNKTQVVVDEQVVGQLDQQAGILYGAKSKQPIAQIDKTKAEQWSIKINEREVASMNVIKEVREKGLSERVFDYVVNGISAEEQAIIMVLIINELVQLAV